MLRARRRRASNYDYREVKPYTISKSSAGTEDGGLRCRVTTQSAVTFACTRAEIMRMHRDARLCEEMYSVLAKDIRWLDIEGRPTIRDARRCVLLRGKS
ncbi:hypothetical protein EVAR_81437_1 [Eumeta japonica]|uniref:Uncharacterized protein n=1 Tax=Eumeta variegata TaxID=151549 RepID=A0A4C1VXW8_EUMVA|nr:hypothetical protein EVAR_81437_1 [Eumeta japonica]